MIYNEYLPTSPKHAETLYFLVALLVYGVGVVWGVPPLNTHEKATSWGPDELAPTGLLLEVANRLYVHEGTYNPQYPLFGYLVQAVPVRVILGAAGYDVRKSDAQLEIARLTTYIARATTVIMAAATVILAYRTAAMIFAESAAWLGGLLALLFQPMFYYGRTSNVDGPSLFWSAIVFWQVAKVIRDGIDRNSAILIGVAAAFSIATKDAAYGAILPAGAIVAVHAWKKSANLVLLAAVISVVLYVLASGLAFDFKSWTSHIDFIRNGNLRHFGFHYGNTSPYIVVMGRIMEQIADNMGMPVLIAAVAGVIQAARIRHGLLLWLLPAAGVIAFSILPQRFVLYRFTIQSSYLLLFFAAYLLWEVIVWRRPLGLILVAAISSWSAISAADFTWQMWNDSRYRAAEWINKNSKPGDRIGYYGKNLKKQPYVGSQLTFQPGPLTLPIEDGPEFLLVTPWMDYEKEHEYDLPEATYQAMVGGLDGYKLVLDIQTSALFPALPGRFVNPPIKIFKADRP